MISQHDMKVGYMVWMRLQTVEAGMRAPFKDLIDYENRFDFLGSHSIFSFNALQVETFCFYMRSSTWVLRGEWPRDLYSFRQLT